MNMLSNIFGNKVSLEAKQEMAELLKTNKDALTAFNKSYEKYVLSEPSSENLFDVNSRQAAEAHEGLAESVPCLDDIIKRIVEECKTYSSVWSFDGKVGRQVKINAKCDNPVTNEEIKKIPKHLRPQLTGSLAKVDIAVPSYIACLDMYARFLKEKNPKKKMMYYHHFRQGLDILDMDEILYKVIGTNPNSMGYWLPKIADAVVEQGFFKIPETTIVKIPWTILQLTRLDYQELTRTTLDIVDKFCYDVFSLDKDKEYFIKTGTYSSKFDFRNAYVHGAKEVRELGEYLLFIHFQACMMASPLSTPCIYGVSTTNEWVVREFIHDAENNPCIYKGLPLHTEYRIFVDFDTKEVLGISPYWEPNTMKKRFGHEDDADSPHMFHDYVTYCSHEEVLSKRYEENKERVCEAVKAFIGLSDMTGQWSIDIMQNGDDFWLIDMALAANSAFVECVPKERLKAIEENWIPQ